MRCGIIDIGTNTIRSAIYEIGKDITEIGDKTTQSLILKYTADGILSDEGIRLLIADILSATEFFKSHGITKTYCIATSAMRDVKNFDDVKNIIYQDSGTEIELLSEEKEALCDFYALEEKGTGAGADIGGGSCQIIEFEKGNMIEYYSFKIGVKRLLYRFGQNGGNLSDYIRETIKPVKDFKSEVLYVMGGTAKGLRKAAKFCEVFKGGKIYFEDFETIALQLENNEDVFSKLIGPRTKTLPYGMEVMRALGEKFGAEAVEVINSGVREGYLIGKFFKNCKE